MERGEGDAIRTSPMPLDHCSARVPSRQSLILHNGTSSLTMICISSKSQIELSSLLVMKNLEGALVTQALSGTMVQRTNVGSQLVIRKNRQVGVFGQILAQQAVGVLIGAAFPGVIRMREEYLQ